MKTAVPSWLTDPVAREFWLRHAPDLRAEGLLTPQTEAAYAVLCDVYADYRNASSQREKNKVFDNFSKLATRFGLIPDAVALRKNASQNNQSGIDPTLAKLIAG